MRFRTKVALAVGTMAGLCVGAVAVASDGDTQIRERLSSFEEVPALATPGLGTFRAEIDRGDGEIRYRLTFSDLESRVLQAHIHFENETNNGPIVAFLCSNLDPAPPGVQDCTSDPTATSGRVTGTITAADVSATPASADAIARGIGVGDFEDFVRAIDAEATYVNVHSQTRPGGEIRAQLEGDHDD
jgi:CHRD domain